jgi:O-antigen biosynthesis protein
LHSTSISQHLLIIGSVWPEPNSSAAGSRMMQLIYLFREKGWKITFASAAAESQFMVDVTEIGIEKVNIELNNSSFDSFVSYLKPSIVLFDRFMTEEQFGWRVAEQCPDAIRILDTEDLHCLRSARQKAWKENRTFVNDDLISDIAKREIASILRCDISLIISDFEMNILQNYFKVSSSLVYYLPFMLKPISAEIIANWPDFESRNNFITIGNFLHEPNWNAVQYLKEDIWPLIRKQLPEAELHIYGAYPSQKVFELNQPKEGFIIKGRVEAANAVVLQARVCLAPLRFGAGIKGKLVEAMQCGTPSVTTDIGVEGMHGIFEWSGAVANTPDDIANAAVDLFRNRTKWLKAQQNGIKIINGLYSKNDLAEPFIKHILSMQNNIKKHRLANFTGAMLMHHTINSTKYMARWIEAKNKA